MFDWLYNFVISILTYLSNLFGLKSNFLEGEGRNEQSRDLSKDQTENNE